MRELSFAIATEKKVAKDYDILDIQNDEYYAHPTFIVGNLSGLYSAYCSNIINKWRLYWLGYCHL